VAVIIVLLMIALFNRLANPSSSNHSSISPPASIKQDLEQTSKTGSRPRQDRWTRVSNESSMDSSKGVILRLKADDEIKGWLQTNRPALIIRCKEKKTELYITTSIQYRI